MSYGFLDIAATPSVRAVQAAMGSAHLWRNFKGHRESDAFTGDEVAFIAQRDSFYMATVSQTGPNPSGSCGYTSRHSIGTVRSTSRRDSRNSR